ncbi:MAG: hypothetical protein IJ225_07000 [Solobacterium sp.]|nr:hypothetical protein [Solobacterium sp.]
MILVILGTNDKPFVRLIQAVEQAVKSGAIQEEVIVQSGFTRYESDVLNIIPYIDREEFAAKLAQADLVITHGGAGTILTALRQGKVVLAGARKQAYGEHVNDHQTQLLEAFESSGYLIYMKDLNDITPYLEQAKSFIPKAYESSRDGMVRLIEDWIDTHL